MTLLDALSYAFLPIVALVLGFWLGRRERNARREIAIGVALARLRRQDVAIRAGEPETTFARSSVVVDLQRARRLRREREGGAA